MLCLRVWPVGQKVVPFCNKKRRKHLSLCMDISDEIEVASILERDATIALPFQSLLTTLVFQWRQKNCAASSELLFCLFSRCCRFSGCVEIGSNVTMLNNSCYATILPRKPILQVLHHEYLLQYSLFCASTFFHVCHVFLENTFWC